MFCSMSMSDGALDPDSRAYAQTIWPRLTVTTLADSLSQPGAPDRAAQVVVQPLDRRDAPGDDERHRNRARAHSLIVHEHRASAAQTGPAAELRAQEAEILAQNPEQRLLRVDLNGVLRVVDDDG